MATQNRMVIHFTDGSKLDIQAATQTEDPTKRVQNIRKAMDADKLMIELEGQLFLVPLANVKYLQVSPAPPNLPDGVIKGATIVS